MANVYNCDYACVRDMCEKQNPVNLLSARTRAGQRQRKERKLKSINLQKSEIIESRQSERAVKRGVALEDGQKNENLGSTRTRSGTHVDVLPWSTQYPTPRMWVFQRPSNHGSGQNSWVLYQGVLEYVLSVLPGGLGFGRVQNTI